MMRGRMGLAKIAALGAVALLLCWQRVEAVRLGYRVERARREALNARSRVEAMRLELEDGLSPAAVAAKARALGLVPAAPGAARLIPSDAAAPASGWLARLTAAVPRRRPA